jgi:tetratricopeptide (TPR) repeat protein
MARLALVAAGLWICGCGEAPRLAARAPAASLDQPQPESAAEFTSQPAPPAAFSAPQKLLPLTTLTPEAVGKLEDQSVLAQYAQQDAAAEQFPTDPIWSLPEPARSELASAGDLRQPSPPPVQQLPPPQAALPAPAAVSRSAMQPVADQARAMAARADVMAQKGMVFSARNELIQSLRLVAQALDLQQGTTTHTAALAAGLAALKEAEDFSSQPGRAAEAIDVAAIARTHRTPLLQQAGGMSPVAAQQQYYNYAQQQLAWSVAGEPAASRVLFTLGKLQLAMAGEQSDQQSLSAPRAMVLFQAALATDSRNYLAANELGVLLARFGQLPDARRALLHSVSIQPHAEGWHNLAIVHQRLGEAELARLAEHERQLLVHSGAPAPAAGGKRVEWVDPRTFAAQSPPPTQRR